MANSTDNNKRLDLSFVRERETKNTVRFQEQGDLAAVGVLYVQKDAVRALGNPDKLQVSILSIESA